MPPKESLPVSLPSHKNLQEGLLKFISFALWNKWEWMGSVSRKCHEAFYSSEFPTQAFCEENGQTGNAKRKLLSHGCSQRLRCFQGATECESEQNNGSSCQADILITPVPALLYTESVAFDHHSVTQHNVRHQRFMMSNLFLVFAV